MSRADIFLPKADVKASCALRQLAHPPLNGRDARWPWRIHVTLSHRRRRRRPCSGRLRLRRIGLGPDLQSPGRLRRQPQRQRQSVSDLGRNPAAVAALLPGPLLQRTGVDRTAGLQRRQLQRFRDRQHQLRLRRFAHRRLYRRALRHAEPAVALHRRRRQVRFGRPGHGPGRGQRHLPGPAGRRRLVQPGRGHDPRRHHGGGQRQQPGQHRGRRRRGDHSGLELAQAQPDAPVPGHGRGAPG